LSILLLRRYGQTPATDHGGCRNGCRRARTGTKTPQHRRESRSNLRLNKPLLEFTELEATPVTKRGQDKDRRFRG
jgi:hypothetical protein